MLLAHAPATLLGLQLPNAIYIGILGGLACSFSGSHAAGAGSATTLYTGHHSRRLDHCFVRWRNRRRNLELSCVSGLRQHSYDCRHHVLPFRRVLKMLKLASLDTFTLRHISKAQSLSPAQCSCTVIHCLFNTIHSVSASYIKDRLLRKLRPSARKGPTPAASYILVLQQLITSMLALFLTAFRQQ